MKELNQDLKTKEFKSVYLLYGTESYLKRQFKHRFKEAIIPSDDTMNYSYYEGKKVSIPEVIELCNTMPFFAERRFVILENSGLFSAAGADLATFVQNLPESIVLMFIEHEVDKRCKLYKAIKDKGHVEELSAQDPAMMKRWIVSLLKKEGKQITISTTDYLLSYAGVEMELLKHELDKLISYIGKREEITKQDIDTVCVKQIQNHIFEMVEAVANQNHNKALSLYHDLLLLREAPLRILSLLTRQYRILIQVKDLVRTNTSRPDIAKHVGVPSYFIGKYIEQCNKYPMHQLKHKLYSSAELEEAIKIGNIKDQMAVEMFIVGKLRQN